MYRVLAGEKQNQRRNHGIIKTNGTFYYVHSYAVVPKEESAVN